MHRRKLRIGRWAVSPVLAVVIVATLLVGVALAATVYPGTLDTTSTLNNDTERSKAIVALETKLGIGTSNASSALTGQVPTKQSNGTTVWATPPGGGGGSGPFINVADYASVQTAVNAAPAGATVVVPAGTYTGAITISKSLELLCFPGAVLKATGSDTELTVSGTSRVTVAGCTIDGDWPTRTGGRGIQVQNTSYLRLVELRIEDTADLAVNLCSSSYIWITDSSFFHTQFSAIHVGEGGCTGTLHNLHFERNVFENAPTTAAVGHSAIQSDGDAAQHHTWIVGNRVLSTGHVAIGYGGWGARFGVPDDLWITGNYIKGNTSTGGEALATGGSRVHVVDNELDGAVAACILFWAYGSGSPVYEDVEIRGNTGRNCAQGLALVWGQEGVSMKRVVVADNVFHNNSFGIQSYLDGATSPTWSDILVHGNVLTGNGQSTSFVNAAAVTMADNLP
jgi:hypothetical protein